VQLPLHILLENHFGDLNENQEELLQAASAAADRIDLAARHLQRILDLEHGRITFQREAVRLGDLLQPVLAIAAARGEERDVKVAADRPPVSPFVVADRYFLGEALTALLAAVIDRAESSSELLVKVSGEKARVHIDVSYVGGDLDGLELVMATRLIQAQQGGVEMSAGRVAITLTASALVRRS
jgi:signal transduction histidine kinase